MAAGTERPNPHFREASARSGRRRDASAGRPLRGVDDAFEDARSEARRRICLVARRRAVHPGPS